ncbi:hypothetical protein BH10BAC2_BH10BAC2_35880 [soil metagenome]
MAEHIALQHFSNEECIKKIKDYLTEQWRSPRTVDLLWYLNEVLFVEKNKREIDIISQGILNGVWFTNYEGHNPNDISIKYSPKARINYYINFWGGVVGLLGGSIGIISAIFKHACE